MTEENKQQLVKRLKSFAWRTGAMVAAATVAFLADNLGLFGFSPQVTTLAGLVLGEVTKFFNKGAK